MNTSKPIAWIDRTIGGGISETASVNDILVCSVAPGSPSYFWPAIDNAERTTPVWYTKAHLAKSTPEDNQYVLSHKFNFKVAAITAVVMLGIYFLISKKLK